MDDTGFGFTERQSSFLKELFDPWSDVGFQYFPSRGRCYEVIGVANHCHAFVDAFAFGWWFWSSVCVFRIKQPFHPIQCHVCQQWGNYTSYKVANFLVEFSTSIPRTQLRPGYGDGFLGAPLQMRQALEAPTPREQGEQRGSSSTQTQQNSGGAPHV
jgi:hypothetical protein